MNWYSSKTDSHQGLVIDEDTGENIAVTFKKENAQLVASAPKLLKACKIALTAIEEASVDNIESWMGEIRVLYEAILEAKGE